MNQPIGSPTKPIFVDDHGKCQPCSKELHSIGVVNLGDNDVIATITIDGVPHDIKNFSYVKPTCTVRFYRNLNLKSSDLLQTVEVPTGNTLNSVMSQFPDPNQPQEYYTFKKWTYGNSNECKLSDTITHDVDVYARWSFSYSISNSSSEYTVNDLPNTQAYERTKSITLRPGTYTAQYWGAKQGPQSTSACCGGYVKFKSTLKEITSCTIHLPFNFNFSHAWYTQVYYDSSKYDTDTKKFKKLPIYTKIDNFSDTKAASGRHVLNSSGVIEGFHHGYGSYGSDVVNSKKLLRNPSKGVTIGGVYYDLTHLLTVDSSGSEIAAMDTDGTTPLTLDDGKSPDFEDYTVVKLSCSLLGIIY